MLSNHNEALPERQGIIAKKQIGSRSTPINYSLEERVFSASDTPADKMQIKQQVIDSLKSRILSNDKAVWNSSTSNADNMQMSGKCYHRTNVNSEVGIIYYVSLVIHSSYVT